MDFRSEGLSWVKGICQKFETSCNEYVDACNNYVNTAGEHFKNTYGEVCEWEEPPGFERSDSCSLNHGTLFGAPTSPFIEPDKNLSNGKSSACEKVQATVAISGGSQILHQRDICNKDKGESLLIASGESDACAREEALSNGVDVSLKHETTTYEDSTKSPTEDSSHENLSIDGNLPRVVSTSLVSDQVAFSNEPQDLSDRGTHDIDKQELLSDETATTCAYDTGESCEKILDTITCSSSCSNLRQDYTLSSESRQGGGLSIVSGICKSEVAIPSMSSLGTKHGPQIVSFKSESSAQIPEIGEPITDGEEQNISSNSDVNNVNSNMELFEDVVLGDNWNYNEMDEINMILDRVSKKTSYKKKLRSSFLSKAGSLMGYKTADIKSYRVDLRYRHMVATSSVPSRNMYPNISSSSEDSIESEWELV